MKKPIANIGILLLLIIILPPLFFTTYEIGNLYQNEQVIDSIYKSQLESVIFSINQYSDDVVSGWANQIEQDLQRNDISPDTIAKDVLDRNVSVDMVFFADTLLINSFVKNKDEINSSQLSNARIQDILSNNKQLITRLIRYFDGGYRKIQPIDIDIENRSLFLFASRQSDLNSRICGLVVNTEKFISENLGPKIQAVAQDKFYLSVFDFSTGNEVYSNEIYEPGDKNIEHKKQLWLMPDYQLGIQLKGVTIEDIVKQRTRFNIFIIIIMDIVLILAAIFVYRGVRQQVRLAQIKSDFVSNVSHEIRTPLAVINMYSETLELNRIKDESKKHQYYSIIRTEANRLSGIVNKILNFSKIESGKRDYKFQETDLNEVIGQIIETYQHHFKSKGFSCKFSSSENLPLISADQEAITDATINLIDNAIKYSLDQKLIEITTGVSEKNVFVEVKDYGVGIDVKDQKQIFEKFYRVTKGNLAYKAKGSGIGLSIVKHIMDAHNGSVTLFSEVGKGSRFILNFPKL